MKNVIDDVRDRFSALVMGLDSCVEGLEKSKPTPITPQPSKATATATAPAAPAADDDNEAFDLFGSDEEEDEEAERIKTERVAVYAAKKSKKTAQIPKSSILLDVKPWDDEKKKY